MEQLIRLCTTYVLQKNSPLTIEKLEKQTERERRKTLGYFLGEVRKRADLDNDFDALLEAFLEERNSLVHGFLDIPHADIQTPGGRKIARSFIDDFLLKTLEIQKVFAGLIRAWQEQSGIDVPFPDGHDLFDEIDAYYKARVDDIFFEKDS